MKINGWQPVWSGISNNTYFDKVYTIDSKIKAGDALKLFCQEFGVPEKLTFDGSKEQVCKGNIYTKEVRRQSIDLSNQ